MTPKHRVHSPEHQNAMAIGVFIDYFPKEYFDITKYQLQFIGGRTYSFAPLVREWYMGTGRSVYTLGEYLCGMIADLRRK